VSNDHELAIRIRRKAQVTCRRLADRAMLLDGASGRCFELNRLGSEVWSLLDGEQTLEEVCGKLNDVLAVPAQTLRSDVSRFAASLMDAGLVETSP
jgi:hypothetical protein